MFHQDEFMKYATKHLNMSSMHLEKYVEKTTPNNIPSFGQVPNIQGFTPAVIEERQLNVAQMDVFSRLMMDRIIFMGVAVTDYVANVVQAQLLFLESTDPKRDVQMFINSPAVVLSQVWACTTPCNTLAQTSQLFVLVWQHLWVRFYCQQAQKVSVLHFHTLV